MNPFSDWRFCLVSALLMLALVLSQGNGMAVVWGALMYANALMLFNKEEE